MVVLYHGVGFYIMAFYAGLAMRVWVMWVGSFSDHYSVAVVDLAFHPFFVQVPPVLPLFFAHFLVERVVWYHEIDLSLFSYCFLLPIFLRNPPMGWGVMTFTIRIETAACYYGCCCHGRWKMRWKGELLTYKLKYS